MWVGLDTLAGARYSTTESRCSTIEGRRYVERVRAVPEVVVVDHHDSYTWNLVHLVAGVTGRLPAVVQHDETTAGALARFTHVVLSPGPGHPADPADFAIGTTLLRAAATPVLGVCLGMQGLVTAYGGTVARVEPAHGEVARVRHDGAGVFAGLPQDIEVVRYHSLAAVALPDEVVATAWAEDGTVMGVRHRTLPLEGVQFHPESVLSTHGPAMVATFLGVS
ncbi:MAG: Anthranilate synthase, amidotransferase component @ Para-aminobenzoate synthase, amidotransferase component [uncultured Nocardioides sp.]|uniref:Anthranilate synthase, amidotransferase component @ Para-aminobenzoate synthase, amidotransferase component n=1 Tax=uncultured Nocardioides sp. TaxID=198441 RepID=A0A6J4PCE1_9ACTN|nr:MAG: Anthranilate synthase, amidotransferase component @ Para-aminobenzoate synthase, amidotransferase component [uncultured Nocardioides sp.]